MIKAAQRYFSGIAPVFIDGLLYMLIAVFTFSQGYFGGDEAAKYISPEFKFWMNGVIGELAVAVGALKMFRSTAYSEHVANKTPPSYTPPPEKDSPTP